MARPSGIYTRLTRNAAGVGSYSSLWLAADHLLIVTSSGYSEDYARVQLRDIKAFFIVESSRRLWWGMVWGVLAFLGAVLLVNAIIGQGNLILWGIFAALLLGANAWNMLLGPGCTAHIMTGVQTARLPALVRLKKTQRVLGRLQPLIEAAQADFATAAFAPVSSPPTLPPSPSPPPPLPVPAPAPVATGPDSPPPPA
jgi:hypothetical protein